MRVVAARQQALVGAKGQHPYRGVFPPQALAEAAARHVPDANPICAVARCAVRPPRRQRNRSYGFAEVLQRPVQTTLLPIPNADAALYGTTNQQGGDPGRVPAGD